MLDAITEQGSENPEEEISYFARGSTNTSGKKAAFPLNFRKVLAGYQNEAGIRTISQVINALKAIEEVIEFALLSQVCGLGRGLEEETEDRGKR